MSDDLHFTDNYRDASIQGGTGAGFQFEFYCQCCNDTWRSPFQPYRSGQASGWMQQASGLLGGLLGNLGYNLDNAAEGLASAGWGVARDAAFRQAVDAAQAHFHRCAHCHNYVCDRCWNSERGLCLNCAPDLAAEAQVARHAGSVEAVVEAAHAAGSTSDSGVAVDSDRQLVCPACGAEAHGAKFCPQCGHHLAQSDHCRHCRTVLPTGSRFCPECGEPATA